MKYLITTILFFVITSCFAVDQKLIDADKQYFAAELKLSELKNKMGLAKKEAERSSWWLEWEEGKSGNFRSENMIKNYRTEVEEYQKLLYDLNIQQSQTKEIIKKLEPMKKKYDEKAEMEQKKAKFEAELSNILFRYALPILILIVFVLITILITKRNQKFYQMMKEGKMSKEEYERLMQSAGVSQTSSTERSPFKNYNVRYGWWK